MFKGVYLEKHVKKAMERLVRITHHKMYALDFVMESDGNGKYKISRRGSEEESKKEQDAKVEDDLLQVDFLDDAMVPVESGAENDEDGYDLVAGIDGEKLTPVKPSKGIDFRLTLFSHKVPTKAEQYEMIIGVKSDDSNISKRAGDKLIRNNARFIFWCAKKFDIYPDNDIFWDVFQEGALGLIRAAQKFNIEKGFKLSTYAGWWVRQFMSRYLARNKRLVHVEYWRMEIFNTIMKAVQEC
ncbi:TPA: hypothetical protein DCZ16_01430 [Candidatus Peregrinibacteria bacterium]|nr:hypothetical protein [Candidatus Peregrinibacteria bacterium]